MLRIVTAALLALFVAGGSYAKENHAKQRDSADDAAGQKILPNFPAFGAIGFPIAIIEEEENKPGWRSPECPNAENHDQADLCEQRRMSKAADDSVTLNKSQVALGVIGFIALMATIGFTHVSTRAAVTANKIARDTAELELRAYVCPVTAEVADFEVGKVPLIHVSIKNTGQTPAKDVSIECCVGANPYPLQSIPNIPEDRKTAGIVGPGQTVRVSTRLTFALTQDLERLIRQGDWAIYAIIDVRYMDCFGKKQTTKFRWFQGGKTFDNPDRLMGCDTDGSEAT